MRHNADNELSAGRDFIVSFAATCPRRAAKNISNNQAE